ncbi:MAG: aminotransferase class IV [Armatimonadota bacterium]|nr:aminotransferase class IV [Armatimonadota bacterium]
MSEPLAYINGEWMPHSEARISIFDSAVMLGDCVTESTRTFNQQPFRLEDHVARLYRSMKVCRYDFDMPPDEMIALSHEVLDRNRQFYEPGEDMWLVHNVSRGGYPMSGDQSGERVPTVMLNTAPMDLTYWAEFYIHGCHAVTPPSRMMPAQSLDPKIKNRSRMAYTLAELETKLVDPRAQGVLLDTDGYITENKGGNFFVIQDGVLRTPPTLQALAGVTRHTTLEIAEDLGIPTEVCDLQPYDVYTADEAFFTSTPYCIMPATMFNGLPVGDGQVGPVTIRLLDGWADLGGVDVVEQAMGQLDEAERDRILTERPNWWQRRTIGD